MADVGPEQPGSIWGNRNFLAALTGGTVNDIGDWMLEIALPVYVYTETRSGVATAAVYLIDLLIGVLVGPVAGSFADRWNLRTTLIATNVLQGLALMPLLFVNADRIWPVYVVAVLQGVISEVNNPASFALIPRVVAEDQIVKANAITATGWSVARLIGSPLGGIVVATGGLSAVIVADAATFAVGVVSMVMISSAAVAPIESGNDEPVDTSVRAGWREIRGRPALAAVVAIQAVASMAFAAFPVVFIVFVTDVLDGDGTDVGLIRGCSAFGGLLASVVISRWASRRHPAQLMTAGYLLFGVLGVGFVNAPPFVSAIWVYMLLFGITGFPNVMSQVGQRSVAQKLCPPEVLGRLSGVMSALAAIGAGIGAGAVAVSIDHVPVRVLFNIQTQLFTVCGLLGLWCVVRRMRHVLAAETPTV